MILNGLSHFLKLALITIEIKGVFSQNMLFVIAEGLKECLVALNNCPFGVHNQNGVPDAFKKALVLLPACQKGRFGGLAVGNVLQGTD